MSIFYRFNIKDYKNITDKVVEYFQNWTCFARKDEMNVLKKCIYIQQIRFIQFWDLWQLIFFFFSISIC